jgi:hypothetical protein
MKSVYFFALLGVFWTVTGCNLKSDHPQSEITDEYATDLTAKTIVQYADSIDRNLSKYSRKTSLVYLLGDLSFYVEKYSNNDIPVLIVEHAFNGASSKSLKKYYFRNDSLILEYIKTELANDEGTVFKNTRTFLRSNTVFKQENRAASSDASLNALPFIDTPLSKAQTSDHSYMESIDSLNDVLNGNDKFDMVFDNITTYPDSRYIILRSKIRNSYSASILVTQKDLLIDSLLNDPIQFKNQKLNINWTIKDQEAVYVPR